MNTRPTPDDELRRTVQALTDCGGNRSEAARVLGMPRKTLCARIEQAKKRFGLDLDDIAGGSLAGTEPVRNPVPPRGSVRRYILTSVQNNTYLHPGWQSLKAYADYLNAEFIVGTYSYALDAYGAKSVKRGTHTAQGDLWYAPEIREYVRDQRIELAPRLFWCGEMNILPTAKNPLTGLEQYNGRASNIIPHAKIEMVSIPALRGEGAKLNYSTGTISLRNYIQKRAGILAEADHCYGGLLVEVDSGGNWYVRQLHIAVDNAVCDIGPHPSTPLRRPVLGPMRSTAVEAITWADLHAAEINDDTRNLLFGAGGMLDTLRPRQQFLHDVLSMRSRNHHDTNNAHTIYRRFVERGDSVEAEVAHAAELLNQISRDWCTTWVVPSNHDRHLTRWLAEADPRKDVVNFKYHNFLQLAALELIERGESVNRVLEIALRHAGLRDTVKFLDENRSYTICGDIECGLHGDLGPNGARGSTRNLARLGRKVNKGHDHAAAISGGVYSTGACPEEFSYSAGPTSVSSSHIVTFVNGTRQIVTVWNGKWRAEP